MAFVPLAAAVALIWKVVDFAKLVRSKDVNGIVTQLAVWGAGVAVFFLLASTDFANGIRIGNMVLGHLNGASVVLIGLSAGSTGSVLYDYKRAFDRSDTATMPSLVSGSVPVVAPVATPDPVPTKTVRRRRPAP